MIRLLLFFIHEKAKAEALPAQKLNGTHLRFLVSPTKRTLFIPPKQGVRQQAQIIVAGGRVLRDPPLPHPESVQRVQTRTGYRAREVGGVETPALGVVPLRALPNCEG